MTTPSTPWPPVLDVGRAFADALQEGLARSAGLRDARRSAPASHVLSADVSLGEYAHAVLRLFASRLPTVLDPAERDDLTLQKALIDEADHILTDAADCADATAGSGSRLTRHQKLLCGALLMECALLQLLDGEFGGPYETLVALRRLCRVI